MNRAYFQGLKVVANQDDIFDPAFIFEIDTTRAGVTNSDQFQFTGANGEYDVLAFQGGVEVASFSNLVDQETITLPSAGAFELRVIPKNTGFDKMGFNGGGDRLKMGNVLQWGDYGVNEPIQSGAFRGCGNLKEISDDGKWFNVVANGFLMFRDCDLSTLPSGMYLPLLSNGNSMFQNNSIELLPSGMELPLLSNGNNMFTNNNLSSLPSGMGLPNLTTGINMFINNTINTTRYSQLLIDLEANNPNNNVTFHGGNSQYNTQGETARDALTARGWTITDGGLE